MNVKTLKRIRKYAKLRGEGNPGLNEHTLITAYNRADEKMRAQFDKEMNAYFEAIERETVKPGESIFHSMFRQEEDQA